LRRPLNPDFVPKSDLLPEQKVAALRVNARRKSAA